MCSLLIKEWFLTSCYSSHTHILHIIDIIVCDIYICVLDIQSIYIYLYIYIYIHLYSKCIYIYHNVGNFLTAKGREFSQELELKEVQTDAPRQEWPTHLSDPRMSWGNSLPFQPWWVSYRGNSESIIFFGNRGNWGKFHHNIVGETDVHFFCCTV